MGVNYIGIFVDIYQKINIFFYYLFFWTAAFLAPLEISFHDFLILFLLFFLDAYLVYSVYLTALCFF